jgi:hypothetical protein
MSRHVMWKSVLDATIRLSLATADLTLTKFPIPIKVASATAHVGTNASSGGRVYRASAGYNPVSSFLWVSVVK